MAKKMMFVFLLCCLIGFTATTVNSKPVYAETNLSCTFNNCGGKLIQFYPGKALTLFDRLYFYARGNHMIDIYYCENCGLVQKK